MAVTKYKGKDLSLTIAGTEYKDNLISVTIVNEEGDTDTVTFADLAAGGAVDWTMEVEAIGDYRSDSLWGYIWANGGTTAAYVLKPYGNATASATQPHFSGNLTVGAPAQIGGTADETFTFEYTFTLTGKPTKAPA
jgi:hypothetical protein